MVYGGHVDLVAVHSHAYALHGTHRILRKEQHIVASEQRAQFYLAGLVGIGHALHVERIGEDQATETDLTFEQIAHDGVAQGAGHALRAVQGGHFKVCHHHSSETFFNKALEGVELQRIQSQATVRDERKRLVTVAVHIAMTGEVFRCGDHTAVLQSAHVGDALARHVLAILAEAAVVDHGVRGIVVHVHYRTETHVYTQALHLPCDLFAHGLHGRIVLHCPQCHLSRKAYGAVQAHGEAPLQVHAQ